MKLTGHTINPGQVAGKAIVTRTVFQFDYDIDPSTGKYIGTDSEIKGEILAGNIFVFSGGRGTSFGPARGYTLKKQGNAPKGMICLEADTITGLYAITADIPMVDKLDKNPLEVIKTGDYVKLDATKGTVEVTGKP